MQRCLFLWSLFCGLAAFPVTERRIKSTNNEPKHVIPRQKTISHPKSRLLPTTPRQDDPTLSRASVVQQRIPSILQTALELVVGPSPQNPIFQPLPLQGDAFWNRSGTNHALPTSRVRRRCSDFWACEHATLALEIDGAIFHNGVLYLHDADAQSREAVEGVRKFYNSLLGRHPPETPNQYYLPPTFTLYEESSSHSGPRWVEGLPIKFIDTNHGLNFTCERLWDSSVYFLHPYFPDNNFHALNDNVFSVLASVLLQHIMGATLGGSIHRTLFLFRNRDKPGQSHNLSPMFKILYMLFDDVKPAREVVVGGPHCIRHMVWPVSCCQSYAESYH